MSRIAGLLAFVCVCGPALAAPAAMRQAGIAADVRPLPLRLERTEGGRLDKGEEVRFITALEAGRYAATVKFASVSRAAMMLAGELILADDEGRDLITLVQFEEVATEQDAVARFALAEPATVVLKLRNAGGPESEYYRVDYSLDVRVDSGAGASASAGALPAEHE